MSEHRRLTITDMHRAMWATAAEWTRPDWSRPQGSDETPGGMTNAKARASAGGFTHLKQAGT